MREILFRGKAKRNDSCMHGGYWVEGDLEHLGDMVCIMVCTYNGFDTIEVIPETVGQYTGLTDKNGRKIFEGDIISKNCVIIRKVEWEEDSTGFFPFTVIEDGGRAYVGAEECEVIGNIYDNPEPLEECTETKHK